MENDSQKQKEIFSKNLQYWCTKKGKNQTSIVEKFNLPASTVSDWFNGKKFPRIDKIQMLADYLEIQKSDLIEEKEESDTPEIRAIARDIVKLKPEKKELFINLLKQMSDEADEASKK